jgi:Ca-activated chloride channel homolog
VTLHPVVSPVALAVVAVVLLTARIATLRRARRAHQTWRWVGITVAAALLLLAALRPVFGVDPQTTPAGVADGQPNVFLVIDRSPAMAEHMADARADATAIVDRYPDARFAVIAFASGPSQDWPLSADTWSLRPILAALAAYPPSERELAQTNVAAAGNVLRYQLISARQQFPRARNLVFYLGSGATGSEAAQRDFNLADRSVDGGAVLGYDAAGAAALRRVAEQLGVPYVPRDPDATDASIFDAANVPGPAPAVAPGRAHPTETYWAPALLAAALLLGELVLTLRDVRRSRS